MARQSVKGNTKRIVTLAILAVIFIVSAVITSDKFSTSWDDLYLNFGLIENSNATEGDFSVHFIDVGQGDCILIKSGTQSMLIDSGENGNADTVLKYIEKEKIEKLDYVVITHPHSDHIGSMADIITNIEVDNVIMTQLSQSVIPTTKVYKNLLTAISNSNANVNKAEKGKTYQLGEAVITVISPKKDYNDLNNSSVVLKADYKNNSFLFMGDAEKTAEEDIINSGANIDADVIKLGHHGSNTSTSEAFINIVTPSFAVISCGEDNSYGHPDSEILDLLDKHKTEYKRTDKNGNITVISNGDELKILTER